MKAVQLHAYNSQPQLVDVPDPEIKGPLDVIVRIGGAGVCRTDLHIIEGQWQEKSGVALPYTIGHENAGWIEAVGDAVTHVRVGDPVILHPLATCGLCRACRDGDDVHCENATFPGLDTDGGYAEYLRTSSRSVVKLPESLAPADVAALADAGLTAYHAVAKAARVLRPGDRAVVIGAGGLGHIGIQVLRALSPVEMIVVDRSPEALAMAQELGADHTVHGRRRPGRRRAGSHRRPRRRGGHRLRRRGRGGGGRRRHAAPGGHLLRHRVRRRGEVPTIDIISTEISFVGNLVGSYNDLVELMVLAARDHVRLHTRTYPLADFASALDDLDHGRVRGRAVLVP